jgi:hypothetical protein
MTTALAIDLVFLLTLLEWPLLLWLTRGPRLRGLLPSFSPGPLLRLLLPGLCLLGVARVLVSEESVPAAFGLLALAGLAHGIDLWCRYRGEMRA